MSIGILKRVSFTHPYGFTKLGFGLSWLHCRIVESLPEVGVLLITFVDDKCKPRNQDMVDLKVVKIKGNRYRP